MRYGMRTYEQAHTPDVSLLANLLGALGHDAAGAAAGQRNVLHQVAGNASMLGDGLALDDSGAQGQAAGHGAAEQKVLAHPILDEASLDARAAEGGGACMRRWGGGEG